MKSVVFAVSAATVLALSGCADNRPLLGSSTPTHTSPTYSTAPSYTMYGTVRAVRAVDERVGASGAGAVLGGVAGGLIGHQVGSGRGNTAATIGGAAAGALIGNEIERRSGASTRRVFQVDVRLDDGTMQTFTQTDSSFRIGERVMIRDGTLMHR